ncbi:MAG: creatininase family protein [Acidobacteria bacterium]|nr:creatininase family protein [Acidobacteriota bacterium]
MSERYRYEEFAWPEIRDAVAENRVCVLPVGTVEQHGPHLPLVTDVLTATEMSRLAVERVPREAVLMPSVYYSFNEHHLDFPGTIAIRGQTIINYVTDVGRSLAHHGFRKILLVNGHGSNVPFLDIAARNITNHTGAICAMAPWWGLIPRKLIEELRESEFPGGMAHGCELETSVLLHLRPDLVQMQKAEKDIHFQKTEFFYWDLEKPSPVFFQEWFSRYSKTGTVGDPLKASAEKGRRFVEAVVERMVALIREFRARQIQPRVDHHRKARSAGRRS